jgi:ParB-like chromosome segregation protein Spo0J
MSDIFSEEGIAMQEKVEKAQQQYLLVDITQLIENPWNPNRMDDIEYKHLKANLDKTGGNKNGPVIVRTHPDQPGKYQIIDGAHRYKAMMELWFEEIVCTLDEGTTPESMIKTLGYNKHRGQNDSLLLSGMIHDLLNTHWYTYEDIEGALGYTVDELKGIDMTADFDLGKYEKDEVVVADKPERITINDTIKLQLWPKQMEQMQLLLKNMWIKDKTTAVLTALKYFDDSIVSEIEKKELATRTNSLVEWWLSIDSDEDESEALIPEDL